jgi:hypothetical protein
MEKWKDGSESVVESHGTNFPLRLTSAGHNDREKFTIARLKPRQRDG